MRRRIIFSLLVALSAAPAFAVVIGELQPGGGTIASRGNEAGPLTIISFSRPALQSGQVDRATVIWGGSTPAGGCDDAFEIKFFRPTATDVQVIAVRGPFDAVPGINNVPLNPAVSIQAGDLIGITQLLPVSCGGMVNRRSDKNEVWGSANSDPGTGPLTGIAYTHGLVPSIRAANEAQPVHGHLPVVGSTAGGFGSLFRTSVQLTNRGAATITGRLVFHPAGASGTNTDPALVYTLEPQQTMSVNDVVVATGATGIGSMDVVTTSGYPPDVTARIFNDEGAAGTSGFTYEQRTPFEAMHRFDRGSLTIPADMENFRMNIGIRTLGDGAALNIVQYDANGVLTSVFVQRSYPANYFEQITASQFLDGAAVAAGGYILIQVESGSAHLYAAVTDNRTNDGAIRFPTKY